MLFIHFQWSCSTISMTTFELMVVRRLLHLQVSRIHFFQEDGKLTNYKRQELSFQRSHVFIEKGCPPSDFSYIVFTGSLSHDHLYSWEKLGVQILSFNSLCNRRGRILVEPFLHVRHWAMSSAAILSTILKGSCYWYSQLIDRKPKGINSLSKV